MNNKRITIISIILAALILLLVVLDCVNDYINNTRYTPITIKEPGGFNNDFVHNEVIISFKDSYTPILREAFLDGLEGVVNYKQLGEESYVVEFDNYFDTRAQLNGYCRGLIEQNDFIAYCEANNIIQIDDCSKGPC